MKAFCINLDHRTDRWQSAKQQIETNGFDLERFSAIQLKPGFAGCHESHLKVLEFISAMNEFPVAVFEDDLDFISPINVMHKAIEEAGEFDMLYLGCDPQEKMVKVDEHLLKLGKAYQTHAIVYGSKRVVDYILANSRKERKIDVFICEHVLHPFNCFSTFPMVVKQSDGFSDITNMEVNFDHIEKKYYDMVQLVGNGDPTGFDENLRYDYDLNENDTVLDIGSHKGEFMERIGKTGCKVIPFDPSINRCAWVYDGEIAIGGGDDAQASFMYEGEKYKCVDILNYLDQEIALCKINIEGGEYQLMEHILKYGFQKNVENFQIQFHPVVDINYEERYQAICNELSKTHHITWKHPFVWENWAKS